MVNPSKVAAAVITVALALTPAAAIASTHPGAKKSAKATCTALDKKEGVKKFDARYGKGKKHSGAMTRCIELHTAKTKKT
jgi:hypothetical protein